MSLKIETNILNGKIPDKINYHTNLKFFLHELLNPLNIISNCAELIDHSNKVTSSQFTNIIIQQVELCNGLSQNLLSQIIKEQDNTVNLCHFLKFV